MSDTNATTPAETTLRYPNLPADHPNNIIDPESPIAPGLQINEYRKKHPRQRTR